MLHTACFPEADRKYRYGGLLVSLIAFFVYANSLSNGFVWDDRKFILDNPALKDPLYSLFSGVYPFYLIDNAPYYRPLMLLSFALEERLHGLSPFLMHFFNVGLHSINAFLVYRLACILLQNRNAALWAGLLFAVHPINTEGVNFISTRSDLLVTFFVLMAYMFHRRSLQDMSILQAFAGAGFFFAAILSKESAFAIVPFIAALELPVLRGKTAGPATMALKRLLPYLAAAVCYVIFRHMALPLSVVQAGIFSGLGSRLLNNIYIIPHYLLTVIWPVSLSHRYYMPENLHALALPLAVAWLSIAVLLARLFFKGRSRAAFFGFSWLVAFLLPVSGIISIPSAPFADRFMYVPAIGLWVLLADRFSPYISAGKKFRSVSVAVATLLILVLAAVTVVRNRDWKDNITLYSRYVEQYPDLAFGHHNLGCAYLDEVKDLDRAELEFNKALAIDPFFPKLRTQMGYARLQRGDYEGALSHYAEAVRLNPLDAEAHLNSGVALEKLSRYHEAILEYRYFLSLPGDELPGSRPWAQQRILELQGREQGT